jgi:hypothetical protein
MLEGDDANHAVREGTWGGQTLPRSSAR